MKVVEAAVQTQVNNEEKIVEPGNSWGRGAGWSSVMTLIELARKPDTREFSAERRDRILQQVLLRVERERERRRVLQGFAAGASAVLAAALLLKLISGGAAPPAQSSPELAGNAAAHRLVVE